MPDDKSWRSQEATAYLDSAQRTGFAWEFLRRNPDYRKDYEHMSRHVASGTAIALEAALALGPSHGRLLLVDPSIGDSHMGHGIVMPSCTHGGPGRAGGGEELGGLRGLWFYHQKVAVQGSAAMMEALAAKAANPASV